LRARWFFLFFTVSGFCALLCQVVWLRLAMARFGVTAAMVAIVLSVFMAGLALGNVLGGRVVGRSARSLLLLYGGCELAVALSALVVPAAFDAGRAVIVGAAWGSAGYHLAAGLAVTIALLPFCVAMGATMPLALAAIGPRVGAGRSAVGHLYAANVLGAAAGTLVSAFVLIERLGFTGTLRLGAAFNAVLALAALALRVRTPPTEIAGLSEAGEARPLLVEPATLVALFATGFASMAMEVVWVRQFAPLLGNVVYAFALILASYLLATLAGSLAYRARSAGLPAAGPAAAVWIAAGLLALLPAIAADPRLGVTRFRPADLEGVAWLRVTRPEAMAAVFLAVAPLSALLGFVTPWLVDRWSRGAARDAGAAWAVNGIGCILGPLAGGFLLLPAVGERGALLVLSLALLGLGLLRAAGSAGKAVAAAAVVAAALIAATRDEAARFPDARVKRDATATVIVSGEGMNHRLLVNGLGMTHLTPITKFMSHLPLAFLGRPPARGLVICFGMGTSFRSMHSWGIDTTGVELVPSVPAFFADFHPDAAGVLSAPDAHIVTDDGRRFLDRTVATWDVVVIDPPPPVEAAGSSLLYSREFYRSIRSRLASNGIVQAWIPGAEPAVQDAMLLALHDVFPYVRAMPSVEGWGVHLLASGQPIEPRTGPELAARMPDSARADLVAWGPYRTAEEQLEAVVRGEQRIDWAALARRAAPLVDDRPVNEYFLLRRMARRPRGAM